MEHLTDLFILIAVIAIAVIIKWFRDFVLLVRAEYDIAVREADERYLLWCRDMLNRIYYQSEKGDKYNE